MERLDEVHVVMCPVLRERPQIFGRGLGVWVPERVLLIFPNFAFGKGVRGNIVANTGEYMVPNFRGGGSAIFNPGYG